MVRGAEGPLGGELPVSDAGRAVDLGDLERLLEARRRQDARQPPRQHRLAGAGRADHQQVVAARRGDLEGALGVLLTADVGQIRSVGPRLVRIGDRRAGRLRRPAPVEQIREPRERRDRAHLDSLHERRLGRVGLRNEQAAVSRAAGTERGGQRAAHRAQLAAQRQLADQGAVLELLGRNLRAGRQQPNRDGQVEARARLAHVRGRKVHGQPLLREVERRVEQRGPHALARLADRTVRQAHEREGGQTPPHVHLDRDLLGMDSVEREGGDRGEHRGEAPATRPTCGRTDATTS